MGLPLDVHLLVQTVLYLGVVVAGLAAAVPIGVTASDLGGQCILYATADWQKPTFFVVNFGRESVCNSCISILVLLSILYPLLMGIYYGYSTCRSTTNKTIGSQMWVMPFMLGNALVTFFIFVVSCIVSVGFVQFCNSFMAGKDKGAPITRCADVQKATFKTAVYTNKNWFNFMTVAQLAAWISFLLWLIQLVFTILRFVRNRRMNSTTNDTTQIANVEPTA